MKQKTKRTQRIIIAVFIAVALFSVMSGNAQNVRTDNNGNFISLKTTDSTSAKITDKTYTDSNGKIWQVYVSKNGKYFVRRISKTGKVYNQYLKAK